MKESFPRVPKHASVLTTGPVGFILGFIPGALVTRSMFTACVPAQAPGVAESEKCSEGVGASTCGATARHVFGAAALASCAGQLVVLGCGTVWIGLKFRTGPRAAVDAGFLPFLPGLAAKSLLCGAAAALTGSAN